MITYCMNNAMFDARNDDMATVINMLSIKPLCAVDAPLVRMSDKQEEGHRGAGRYRLYQARASVRRVG